MSIALLSTFCYCMQWLKWKVNYHRREDFPYLSRAIASRKWRKLLLQSLERALFLITLLEARSGLRKILRRGKGPFKMKMQHFMEVIFWQLTIQNYYVPVFASMYSKQKRKMGTNEWLCFQYFS